MAQGTKGPTAQVPPTGSESNGTTSKPTSPGAPSVNRKKQKRRAKQAARQAAGQDDKQVRSGSTLDGGARNGHVAQGHSTLQYTNSQHQAAQSKLEYGDAEYDDHDQYEPEEVSYYSEDDDQPYNHHYASAVTDMNGQALTDYGAPNGTRKKSKKKGKSKTGGQHNPYLSHHDGSANVMRPPHSQIPPPPPPPPPLSSAALRSVQNSAKDRIWNTSTQEERERIKEFWLSLGEEERKSLVKIEKEAVLRKMKEQQKHSCSCTVCGRKRTAIEEELEVLYDAYYEELEHYANHQQDSENGTPMLPPRRFNRSIPADRMPSMMNSQPLSKGRIRELADGEDLDEDDEEEEDEEYSDGEDDGYSDEDEAGDIARGHAADFFNFGNSLTVKGGILTVADDLLKNDGKKFIEMMEQLAERRMQREEEAQYASAGLSHPMDASQGNTPGALLDEEDELEEDDDYDSQEDDYDDEEDETDTMTDEQRMEEGRRMFQIFAARMFEQRVLTAYREKVARERQQKLLEELEEESRLDVQREAKKARDAQKKKDKKQQQKLAKAEEKARKEAEKAAEEAAARELEEKKQEEQRRKREEQRKKKEAERKAQEEERQKKEMEKQRRLQEERERQQEAERKIREQKAMEKKAKEEARKKERELREAREREVREKKAQEEKERREREAKAKAEQEAKDRVKREQQAAPVSQQAQAGLPKRPSAPSAISLPLGLHPKQVAGALPSPHVPIAKPAIPKAPTPVKPRQNSQQHSHASSPKTPHAAPGSAKSASPKNAPAPQQPISASKGIAANPQTQQTPFIQPAQPISPTNTMAPPLGLPGPPIGGSLPVFPQVLPSLAHQRPFAGHNNMPAFHPQGPPVGGPFRGFISNPLSVQPPELSGIGMAPHGRGFPLDAPPGFPQPVPGMASSSAGQGFGIPRETLPAHSRQHSASLETSQFERTIIAPQAHPIARPAPIRRPSSAKPREAMHDSRHLAMSDMDDLSNHLGSSALLADTDEPIPINSIDSRRPSMAPGSSRSANTAFGNSPLFPELEHSRIDAFGRPMHGGPASSWNTPSIPFGPPGVSAGPNWGTPAPSGWSNPNAFGIMGGQSRPSISRPVSLRLMVCQACKQLTAIGNGSDGFQDIANIARHVDSIRPVTEPPAQISEVLEICETEGNAHNGGGNFVIKRDGPDRTLVKYEPDENTPQPERSGALVGEIGSPLQGYVFPNLGSSRPFPPLGGVTSPGF